MKTEIRIERAIGAEKSEPFSMNQRVVMLVSNPCNPDYRVSKQAESLVRAGYEVFILATWRPKLGIPIQEEINGVIYIRHEWNVLKILRMLYLGEKPYREIPKLNRSKHRDIVKKLSNNDTEQK